MVPTETVKHRALQMGINTGEMPEVEFIWSAQKALGHDVCFGQGSGCQDSTCRWRGQCYSLDKFADSTLRVTCAVGVP